MSDEHSASEWSASTPALGEALPGGPPPSAGQTGDTIAMALSGFKAARQSFDRAHGEVVASEASVAAVQAEAASAEEAHKATILTRDEAANQLRKAVDDMIGALQFYRSTID